MKIALTPTILWCYIYTVTLRLRIGSTHGPVALVLARAAGLYPAHTGSIPVTGSKKPRQHQSAGANPTVMFEDARPDHFRL